LYSNMNICFLSYEYIWYSYSVKLTWRIYIRCIFGVDLLDIRDIFGLYSNIGHRISIIRIRIFYFIETNIFGIRIRSKSKLFIFGLEFDICVTLIGGSVSRESHPSLHLDFPPYLLLKFAPIYIIPSFKISDILWPLHHFCGSMKQITTNNISVIANAQGWKTNCSRSKQPKETN
jgi:hypothetical protein